MPIKTDILVITPEYGWFVKNLIDVESKSLNNINVLIHYNYLTEISRYMPSGSYFEYIRQFLKDKIIDSTEKPENVNIHLLSMLYFIVDGQNKRIGDKIAKKFENYIKKYEIKFDLIHAHFLYPQGYVAVKLAERFNVPVVVTAHGHDVYDMPFKDEDWTRKIKSVLNRTNHVITVSNSNKEILVDRLNIEDKKISVIPNGFDSFKFKPITKKEARERLNLSVDKKIILNVANLNPIKGHEFLIKAMKNIVKQNQDVLCIIIGGGRLRKKLEGLIKESDLEDFIKLIGTKLHTEISLWMNAADIFVLPSINEGNPTVMFEALGVGLPFVGTAVGGIPEIIDSEDKGLLVEPANPKDLTEKIMFALEKKWDENQIIAFAKKYTWENIAKQTLEIYKTIL